MQYQNGIFTALTYNWNVHQVELFQNNPQSLDSPLQNTSISYIKSKPTFFQKLSTLQSLFFAFFVQLGVGPSSENIQIIPGRFPMADEDEFVGIQLSFAGCLGVYSQRGNGGKGRSCSQSCCIVVSIPYDVVCRLIRYCFQLNQPNRYQLPTRDC